MGRLALVIDAHIVGDNVDMMVAREAKIRKYSDNPGIDAAIKSKPGVVEVRHCPSHHHKQRNLVPQVCGGPHRTRRALQEGYPPHVGAGD